MYKISVPIISGNVDLLGRERILKELKRLGAERVFLAINQYTSDENVFSKKLSSLRENVEFFHSKGFEVGAWGWSFWVPDNTEFCNMRSVKGTEIKEFMCPADKRFVEFAKCYFKEVAKTGVDIIQFDDDFRYGFLSDSPGCLCDNHIARINEITCEASTCEELAKHILNGGKNKYRDAWLKANGDAFREFAVAIREAIDEVNPSVRISVCSCMTLWDIDGTSAAEIAHLLAGNTKPILRLIGAPYWAAEKSWGNELQDVIELERMEAAWTQDCHIEIMAEGDTYPRPRIKCPAAYLEGFDTAIRASGCTDGILKYGIDYISNAYYETGYANFHERNLPLYDAIDEMFGGKQSCGVRVYEAMKKVADAKVQTKVNQSIDFQDLFFSRAARTLAYNTIPTVYEGEGVCGIAFDENARHLPQTAFNNGLIIDIAAAEILKEQGIDVGLKSIGEAIKNGVCERFCDSGNCIGAVGTTAYDIEINENCDVLSELVIKSDAIPNVYLNEDAKNTQKRKEAIPFSYHYENANGQRFLVLNINTRSGNSDLLRHYARSRQYAESVKWLSGNKLSAYVYGNPALYIQCKKQNGRLAVGLWNFFADIAINPVVELDKAYSSVKCINCTAIIDGDKVKLSDIPAYGFVGFEVK